MPQISEPNQTHDFPPVQTGNYSANINNEEIVYPEQRADDMGETSFHYKIIADLMQMLQTFFRLREDVFLTANMNIYYAEGNPYKWFAPDILAAFGVSNADRSVYKIWQEKVFPQVVFEVASSRTWKTDVNEKLKLYEQLGAEEYYILDSENGKYLSVPLLAFQRQNEKLVSVLIEDNKIFSPRLGLEIIKTENSFRLFNPQAKEFLRTLEESEAELSRLKAEIERLKSQK